MNVDFVTLLQIEKGARIYACVYNGSNSEYLFKADETYEKGDYALVGNDKGEGVNIVRVRSDVTETFIPQDGITYRWLGAKVPPKEQLTYKDNVDRDARRKLMRGAMIEQAKKAVGLTLSLDEIMPGKYNDLVKGLEAPPSFPGEYVPDSEE